MQLKNQIVHLTTELFHLRHQMNSSMLHKVDTWKFIPKDEFRKGKPYTVPSVYREGV